MSASLFTATGTAIAEVARPKAARRQVENFMATGKWLFLPNWYGVKVGASCALSQGMG